MGWDTPADAMRDMAAIYPRSVKYLAPANAQGDQVDVPRLANGVKVFELEASVIRWNILSGSVAITRTGKICG